MVIDQLFIFCAQYLFIGSFIISGIYFLKQTRPTQKRMLIFGITAVIIIYLLSLVASCLYNNPRPFVTGNFTPLIPHAANNGFPSDHTLLLSAVTAIMTYFSERKFYLALWVIALLVGSARVYVGVHHSIDIIGSIVISIIGTLIVSKITQPIKKKLS